VPVLVAHAAARPRRQAQEDEDAVLGGLQVQARQAADGQAADAVQIAHEGRALAPADRTAAAAQQRDTAVDLGQQVSRALFRGELHPQPALQLDARVGDLDQDLREPFRAQALQVLRGDLLQAGGAGTLHDVSARRTRLRFNCGHTNSPAGEAGGAASLNDRRS
jgi:hypothetical protein